MFGRYRSLALVVATLGTLAALPASTCAQSLDVTGTVTNRVGRAVGTFAGTLDLTQFQINNAGDLVAVGTLTGTLTSRGGDVMSTVSRTVAVPVAALAGQELLGVCEILHLELGPLDLNVLGLVVHLDRVVLDISANPAGGLLGELLCALADGLGLDLGDLLGLPIGDLLDLINLAGLLDDVLDILNGIFG
jgi:hypothetical protein